jgi:hypothetical protein
MINYVFCFIIILILIYFYNLLFKCFDNNFIELFETKTLNKPNFTIYLTRIDYIPLILYLDIIKKTFKKYNYTFNQTDNLSSIELSDNMYFMAFGLDMMNDDVINFLIKNKIQTIMINTEHYTLYNVTNIIENLNNKVKFQILDYNSINIIKLKEQNKITYLPLLYDEHLVETYNSHISSKINLNDKDIDILVYGSINERRGTIINKLSKKYNVLSINTNFSELCKYIERSKIILNLYYYEFNKPFDYYRMTFLLSNKIFTISEYPSDINLSIESVMVDYDKYLILTSYDDTEETVSKYLDNWNPIEINDILEKQFEWFSRNKMENHIINFLTLHT